MTSNAFPPHRLAILRTMGALHMEPLEYDLKTLNTLILQLAPDLVCADITQQEWESGDLSGAPLEVREALAPAIALTDTVLVPIASTPQQYTDFRSPPGIRHWLSVRFDRMLQWGQRRANTVAGVHGGAFEAFCHTVCAMEERTWTETDRAAYQIRTRALAENVVAAVERDPGGRVLVVIQCQWHHTLEHALREKANWLEIVDYAEL